MVTAAAYGNLGRICFTRGELDRAEEMIKKSLAIEEKLGLQEGMAVGYGNLGVLYRTRGELDRAEDLIKKSLAINEKLGHQEGMADQYGNLGVLYQTRGELDRAEEMHKGADLWNANLKEALYEPESGTLPEILSLRTAKNLETMRFVKSPHALEDLRREFKRVGFKEQERQITYAIKRSEQLNAWEDGNLIEPFFNYVFSIYPWPTAYVQDGRYGFLFR